MCLIRQVAKVNLPINLQHLNHVFMKFKFKLIFYNYHFVEDLTVIDGLFKKKLKNIPREMIITH